jgi:hypothetical protein
MNSDTNDDYMQAGYGHMHLNGESFIPSFNLDKVTIRIICMIS